MRARLTWGGPACGACLLLGLQVNCLQVVVPEYSVGTARSAGEFKLAPGQGLLKHPVPFCQSNTSPKPSYYWMSVCPSSVRGSSGRIF